MRGFNWARWAPDGRSLISQGTNPQGQQGIYRIDARTATVVQVAVSTSGGALQRPVSSPDGARIYYLATADKETAVVERTLASGATRELARGAFSGLEVSPDGRSIASISYTIASRFTTPATTAVVVMPVAGGGPRELLRVAAPEHLRQDCLAWTRDGRLLVQKFSDSGNRREFWLLSLDGGEPKKVDLQPDWNTTSLRVHPDGRRVTYVAGQVKWEVMVLENFLPADTKKESGGSR
jgi:Tol biopolymer transport system component